MKYHASGCRIEAPPERVWEILVAVDEWPEWVENVSKVEGTLAPGQKVVVHARSRAPASRRIVTAYDPPRILVLTVSAPLSMYRSQRSYTLAPVGAATEFAIREDYLGPLAPIVTRALLPNGLQSWFDSFADRLKERVESAITSG